MIRAIILDCFGVIVTQNGLKDAKVIELILSLRKQYKTALLSNIGQQGLRLSFTPEELHKYFDTVVISGDEGLIKPEPAIYRRAAELLNVELHECIFIDDLEMHCIGARNTGMHAIEYRNFAQAKHEIEILLANTKD